MQFFDRPGRSRIALGGSSSHAATSAQLLAQARKAREERALRRAKQNAALTIQSLLRRHVAIRKAAELFCTSSNPSSPRPLEQLLLVSCVFSDRSTNVARRVDGVEKTVDVTYGLGRFIERLEEFMKGGGVVKIGDEGVTEGMVVKGVAVVLAVAERKLRDTGDAHFLNIATKVSIRLVECLSIKALETVGRWGVCLHLTKILATVVKLGVQGDLVSELVRVFLNLLESGGEVDIVFLLYGQIANTLLAIDGVLKTFKWMRHPTLVKNLLKALAVEEVKSADDGFHWDAAMSVAQLSTRSVAIALSNVLELGDALWAKQDKETLWSFIAVVSKLLEMLPQDVILKEEAKSDMSDDEVDEDKTTTGIKDDAKALRNVVSRLSLALKRVVSDDNVRVLLTGATMEGRNAVIRVCQLFNFLTRREKSLNMSLQHSLAFWRRSKTTSQPHILSCLWNLCLKNNDDNGSKDSILDVMPNPLREETAPILVVFACSYSYLLYIQDEDEMFESQWPFSLDEVREIALVLKQYMYSALYVRPTSNLLSGNISQSNLLRKEPGLLDEVSRLLSRLYNCDSRRKFRTSDDFWLAGRGALSSDAFLEDAVEAGPEALARPAEMNAFGGVRQVSSRLTSVNGAGELLRMAPYLVPFSSRAKIFQSWISEERDKANGGLSFFPAERKRSVRVRRKFIFEDAFEELNALEADLKATIRVKFIDEHGIEEAGIDGGGVFKEFMYEVLRLGFSPFSYGLFKSTPDGRLYPSPNAAVATENFKTQFSFLGRLLGKAVFDSVLVDIPLARFFLSKILGQFNYPNDLGSLDPELHKNMKFLKNYPPDLVEDLCLNFTVANNAFGSANEVELVRNGKNIPVTASNRIEYIHRVANYRMNTQIKQQSEAFLSGFSEVVSPQFIRLFSQEELQLLISGKTGKIDLDDLRRNTNYSGGYSESTDVIKWFWQAVSDLGAEDQGKMLQFVTSSPRAPLLGFSYLVPGFCIHRAEGDVRLPTASTCMNLLKLPEYKSLDVVQQKLRYALDSNAGFDLS